MAYTDAINGVAIGPSAGSCGTAAFRGEPVIVEDIATDPLWAEHRDLALRHSLRACWSVPVSSQGKVTRRSQCTIASRARPTEFDQEFVGQITHLAGSGSNTNWRRRGSSEVRHISPKRRS